MRGTGCMDAQSRRITIVQQNGKWVVSEKTNDHSSHKAFETEAEARQFARQLTETEPLNSDEA